MACRVPQHLFQHCDSEFGVGANIHMPAQNKHFSKKEIKGGLIPTYCMLAQVHMIITIGAKC